LFTRSNTRPWAHPSLVGLVELSTEPASSQLFRSTAEPP